ncbi:NAD(P)-binding domain-containing protein [Arthrobacter alpinus]|nr:NAD(P)-binding domain-containing protein [Arthrobacter alpinus]
MSQVTIIGNGHMARAIAVRMIHARHSVQILGRDGERTRELVEDLGAGATGAEKRQSSKAASSFWQSPMRKQ